MALSSTFSLPRGFLGVLPQEHHYAPAAELHARPLKVRKKEEYMIFLLCSGLADSWSILIYVPTGSIPALLLCKL